MIFMVMFTIGLLVFIISRRYAKAVLPKLILPASGLENSTPIDVPDDVDVSLVEFKVDKSIKVYATHLKKGKSDTAPTLIVVNPNGVTQNMMINDEVVQRMLRDFEDINILTFDYPSVGDSTGKPLPQNLIAAGRAVYQYAHIELGIQKNHIHLYGWSLGGFIGVQIAKEEKHDGTLMVYQSGTSLIKTAHHLMPWFIRPFLWIPIQVLFRTAGFHRLNSKSALERMEDTSRVTIVNTLGDHIFPLHKVGLNLVQSTNATIYDHIRAGHCHLGFESIEDRSGNNLLEKWMDQIVEGSKSLSTRIEIT